ncbi:class I SAM-dependent methyltransferase [Desulfopila aestuarii]|uniref:Methyltransferase domain-containing protein n=1 Tax=Desulfopila aestuarii DSM 18488 TaxID=1121416 RepID=A0A1M7YD59_9BACT|nr:class I SAM-dependent methyltransferase [Desulfopila aestuarii]SHO50574.1 Methyltransferase domain-containing protein [Desulfopila aestuarii DSM 18488]
MKIYADYDEEPREEFLALPAALYRQLYDLELHDFSDDFPFYQEHLPPCSEILELGCGSGRLTRLLTNAGHCITGIDLSPPMLLAAQTRAPGSRLVCMDMRKIAFRTTFAAIIIPYNTLNLLADNDDVVRCLTCCREHLQPEGQLLIQLYIPNTNPSPEDSTSFQFQIFDRPEGGRVVKETLRTFHPATTTITMEERYKIRPMNGVEPNCNYKHTMTLNANSRETWLNIINSAGFTITSASSSYTPTSPTAPTLLLIKASTPL